RCIIVDAYFDTTAHSQGIYASKVDGLLVEECVIDHNGWKGDVAGTGPTIFNHNIYVQGDCGPATIRRNIISAASSHGCQLRPGGMLSDNLFIGNPLAAFVAADINPVVSTMENNVVYLGRDIDPANQRGSGLEVHALATTGAIVRGNIISQREATGYNGTALAIANKGAVVTDNIIYNWSEPAFALTNNNSSTWSGMRFERNTVWLGAGTSGGFLAIGSAEAQMNPGAIRFSGNRYFSAGPTSAWFRIGGSNASLAAWNTTTGDSGVNTATVPGWSDPSRNIASYNLTLGGSADTRAFLTAARSQRRSSWDRRLTAIAVNEYVREGFGVSGGR
ncbi:MAG: right-handed parallel beta-helix repeat-containing protein, partial [Planctomycetota bacterium]|nr:right-handed parallel beta-helix repeat-containing protein [Planctomycetota bacterium]